MRHGAHFASSCLIYFHAEAQLQRPSNAIGTGSTYNAEDENIVGNIATGSPLHFETLAGLATPGVTASFRLYAITAEGNERASDTVSITRPV